jgi:hypothetical protein
VVLSPGMPIHSREEDMSSSFNQVTVLGAGVLGAQISFQIAPIAVLKSLPMTSATLR